MTPETTIHLSEESLDDVLIGLGSPESHAHLAACAECRVQVEAFRGDMELFNDASRAWSESRPPLPRISAPRRTHPRLAFGSWAVVCAALVFMAVAIWHRPAPLPNHAIVQPQPADSEAQIAQDNQLLEAVNAAISPDEESPIDEYNIRVQSPPSHAKPHSKLRVK
jgi:anti-sigma factor RsiW